MDILSVVFFVDDAFPGDVPLSPFAAGDFFGFPVLFLPGDWDRDAEEALTTFWTSFPTFEGVSLTAAFFPLAGFLDTILGAASTC
jgi:hypothetical protein